MQDLHNGSELPEDIRIYIKNFHRKYNSPMLAFIDAMLYFLIGVLLHIISFIILMYYDNTGNDKLIVFMLFLGLYVLGLHGLSQCREILGTWSKLRRDSYKWAKGRLTGKHIVKVKELDHVTRDHYMMVVDGMQCEALNKGDYDNAGLGEEFIIIYLSSDKVYCLNADMKLPLE